MAYDKFNILTSTAVPLSIENVDTDQIIPARFLKQQSVLVLVTTFSATGDTMTTHLSQISF
jgi:3-isopropylmalate dehydratase small subunit